MRPAFVPLLLTAVTLLFFAILYNIRCTRLMKVQENTQHQEKQKKEPEEHDERFATGGYFCNEVDFFVIVIYFAFIQNALIFGFAAHLWHFANCNIKRCTKSHGQTITKIAAFYSNSKLC